MAWLRLRVRLVVVLVALVALLAAACGGDDKEEAGGGALTKAEFVRQANAVCKASEEEFNQLFETVFPTTREKVPVFFEKATPIVREQLDGLRALAPPEGDEEEIRALLATGDKVLADFERAATDAEFGSRLFSEEGGANNARFEEQAKAYGLTACVEDGGEEEEGGGRLDPATFSPEKRAYVEKVDAVCRSYQERFDALEEQYLASFPPPIEGWAAFLPALAGHVRDQLAEIRAIEPPAADRAKVEGLLAGQEALLPRLEAAAKVAAAGDSDALDRELQPLFGTFEELDAESRAYGFQVCGSEDEGD